MKDVDGHLDLRMYDIWTMLPFSMYGSRRLLWSLLPYLTMENPPGFLASSCELMEVGLSARIE